MLIIYPKLANYKNIIAILRLWKIDQIIGQIHKVIFFDALIIYDTKNSINYI